MLASKATLAHSLWQRMKGLLGRSGLSLGEALVIPRCTCIHTWFMRFPIDAVFVDQHLRVVKTMHQVVPFRLTLPVPDAWGVIELVGGTVSRSGTAVADQLEWHAR